MKPTIRYVVRVYDPGRVLRLVRKGEIPLQDEAIARRRAAASGREHAGAVAYRVVQADDGHEIFSELCRYGQILDEG